LFSLAVGVPVHLVPYLGERGYDVSVAAAAAGAIGATQLVGRLCFAPLERRVSPRVVSLGVFALQPLALLALLLVPSTTGVVVFVVLFGAGRGAETLMRSTVIAGRYGPLRFASIAGVLTLVITGAQAVSPVSLGAAYDRFGRYEPGLWALVLVTAAAAAAIYIGNRREHRAAQV